jgi:hypothetical protein
MPITVSEAEGAQSLSLSFGLGLTYAINEAWSLTPATSIGLVGSKDLASAAGMGALSLTSANTTPKDGYSINYGNMIGYYQTLDLQVGDLNINRRCGSRKNEYRLLIFKKYLKIKKGRCRIIKINTDLFAGWLIRVPLYPSPHAK